MNEQLNRGGFDVVLGVAPGVPHDRRRYQQLASKRFLLLAENQPYSDESQFEAGLEQAPALQRWWNGASAVLDLSNPAAFAWFQGELDRLTEHYDIDGFKFDGGDPFRYQPTDISYAPRTPNGHSEDYGRIGLKYDISEYRACWKLGGQHLLQPLLHKP